jgi:hypothetical protein
MTNKGLSMRYSENTIPSLFRFSSPSRLSLTLTEEEGEYHRLDTCFFYDTCLTRAAILNWASFSCAHCRIFLEEEKSGFMSKHPEINQLFSTVSKIE